MRDDGAEVNGVVIIDAVALLDRGDRDVYGRRFPKGGDCGLFTTLFLKRAGEPEAEVGGREGKMSEYDGWRGIPAVGMRGVVGLPLIVLSSSVRLRTLVCNISTTFSNRCILNDESSAWPSVTI
jgi:hypothetical protein